MKNRNGSVRKNFMNFIFISPQFPRTYWNFCDRLKKNGVNVLGIGDTPYDALPPETRGALNEYYRVNDMENYDEVFRAVAFFSFKYGKIDWIESNNEHWLEQDARLRTDFNVTTGVGLSEINAFKSKSAMKAFYARGGVPTARFLRVTTLDAAEKFVAEVGFPVVVKPDIGVGASNTWALHDAAELREFFANPPHVEYIMEEFVRGDIFSFDAITDENCNILFESMTAWPPSIMDIVNFDLDLAYHVSRDVPAALKTLGRKTVAAFGARRRFVHLEFFRLAEKKRRTRRGGRFRRARSQHASGGRLHAGHDEFCAFYGRLSNLGGHGDVRRAARSRGGARIFLRLREPKGRQALRAHARGNSRALRERARHVRTHARADGAHDGQPDVHGKI